MDNIFGNMNTDGQEDQGDRLGGGGTIDTGIYDGTVKLAYVGKSQSSQSMSITVHLDFSGFEYRETIWVTNRNNENYYVPKNDPTKKVTLPGYVTINDLCLLTTGYGLAEQDMEEKVVKLYDFEQKADVPKSVPVITSILGKPITAAIFKNVVSKRAKGADGNYHATSETREENEVDKFFHFDSKRTVTELKNQIDEAIFIEKWKEKNAGKPPRDRTDKNAPKAGTPGAGGTPGGAPAAGAAAAKPKSSLFG